MLLFHLFSLPFRPRVSKRKKSGTNRMAMKVAANMPPITRCRSNGGWRNPPRC